jgi:uncharacterized protein (TIGR03435 family)
MKKALAFAVLTILAHHAGGQSADLPAFEVASITPCKPGTPEPPGEHMGMVQYTFPGGRFNATASTLKALMEWAYSILPAQHSSGPAWMESDRYDVVAKAPGKASDDEMKLMTRSLLAERFHLKLRHETREMSVFVLSLGKTGPKLFPPKEDDKHSLRIVPQSDDNQKIASYHVVATRFSFAQLNLTFSRQLGRVLVNQTGLDGEFNFAIDLTPDESRPNPLDPSLILEAMRAQLGLNVKSEKAPVDYWFVEGAEKVAAGN